MLTPKSAQEIEVFTFDYYNLLSIGETLVSAAVSVTVSTGTDANPSAMLDGAPQIQGSQVLQLLQGGLSGVTYNLNCLVTTSKNQKLLLTGSLQVTA